MKTYLITGAAQGLGKALTLKLLSLDHQVILLDKELKHLNALYDEIEKSELNIDLVALYPMDLLGANIEHYQDLKKNITNEYQTLDGVFLNAAILPAFTPIEHFDYMQWYEVLHTNLNANFHLIQQTLPLLSQSTQGKLVAITDNNVKQHPAYYGAYGVAKAGLEQLLKTVSEEIEQTTTQCYLAHLETFATESRGRLFPGENPTKLTSAETMASFVINHVFDQPIKAATGLGSIEKL